MRYVMRDNLRRPDITAEYSSRKVVTFIQLASQGSRRSLLRRSSADPRRFAGLQVTGYWGMTLSDRECR